MGTLFINIKELVQVRESVADPVSGVDMNVLPGIEHAYLLVKEGRIAEFGYMQDCPSAEGLTVVDADGRMILPSWCDSHTHIVYAGNREDEFLARLEGKSYEEIAAAGGGILNSAKTLQLTSEDDLYEQSARRLRQVIAMGTGAIEIKSGYGLTVDAELKMLRVIKRLANQFSIPIRSTFLAAHALPTAYKADKAAYLRLMIEEVLPLVASEGLADYIDVFCEDGYFDVADTIQVMEAGARYGLPPKIHVNQFNAIGGVAAGVQCGALSVDHLEVLQEADIEALVGSATIPVTLPLCSFFLGIPYTPARKLISAGLPLAIATDYNPGSSPSGNMNFAVSTACIKQRLTPSEAINAATINGAFAMGLENEVGSITVGKRANLILTRKLPSLTALPYGFAMENIDRVYVEGVEWGDY